MNKIAFKDVNGGTIYLEKMNLSENKKSATEVCISNSADGGVILRWGLMTAFISSLLLFAVQLQQAVGPTLLTAFTTTQLCLLLYRIYYRVVSEHLLLVAGLGAQVTTTFFTGRSLTLFVPWHSLVDVIIAETITMQRVLYYMALLVKKESAQASTTTAWPLQKQLSVTHQLLPLFMHSWPRLSCLREVYRSCQTVLRDGAPSLTPPTSSADCQYNPHTEDSVTHEGQTSLRCDDQ